MSLLSLKKPTYLVAVRKANTIQSHLAASLCDYIFQNNNLKQLALTHSSNTHGEDNEILEFLGDAVLQFIITSQLLQDYSGKYDEGELTRWRTALVKNDTLADIAAKEKLLLNTGASMRGNGGAISASMMADAVEALIGAIYLDAGIELCTKIVVNTYKKHSIWLVEPPQKSPKNILQEFLQKLGKELPEYIILDITMIDDKPVFKMECKTVLGSSQGEGGSKTTASQIAAKQLLQQLGEDPDTKQRTAQNKTHDSPPDKSQKEPVKITQATVKSKTSKKTSKKTTNKALTKVSEESVKTTQVTTKTKTPKKTSNKTLTEISGESVKTTQATAKIKTSKKIRSKTQNKALTKTSEESVKTIQATAKTKTLQTAKKALYDWLRKNNQPAAKYDLLDTEHDSGKHVFTVECKTITCSTTAESNRKLLAERLAAKRMLQLLQQKLQSS